ncbi:amidohydrolase [Thermanaeromonas toyohensis ToBE]|uniref:Peptidase M20 domain-containing protein 2 n=1 Tax=Thermanaeromonas toyohensis ToBE TaxID=698762 RepID=A0A1W1VBJ4_9FIRM|nr:M20 family metallopeptidase [Thermanaeromonas toyohensis]SMB90344.1 amidohydrolase [Thermanaeromonas toyohensis ToBE]
MSLNLSTLKKRISNAVETYKNEIIQLAEEIFDHPEVGQQEFFASRLLTQTLAKYGFEVLYPLPKLPTGFQAVLKCPSPGPRVALLAEYDALPELGHACGHNLIGAAVVGAGLALAAVKEELRGEVLIFGTPAEESNGGKVVLVEEGAFQGVDAALIFHPGDANIMEVSSLALEALEFIFEGRAAHASSSPEEGINALEALIQFFNNINSLRPYLKGQTHINGIITEGGVTPNIIPERAVARFYIRAENHKALKEVLQRVENCARGAALATGCSVAWRNYEFSYDAMVTNKALAGAFKENLRALGVTEFGPPRRSRGSLDMGNVSRVVPAIHPYLALGSGRLIPHTREFARAARGEAGRNLVMLAAKALAWTAADVLLDGELLTRIQEEFSLGLLKEGGP